ncbi:MAG: LysM peptidoglycan-binding domain-containing protein, partial [Elusimicrobia bacterium]|nr:LysM peptidoglycan-binding domain-containing protein [Elusimicrobiota bacterium]
MRRKKQKQRQKELERLVVEIDNAIGQADAVIEQLNAVQLFSSDAPPILLELELLEPLTEILSRLSFYLSSPLAGKTATEDIKRITPINTIPTLKYMLNDIKTSLTSPEVMRTNPRLSTPEAINSLLLDVKKVSELLSSISSNITQHPKGVKAEGSSQKDSQFFRAGSSEKDEIGTASIEDEEKSLKRKEIGPGSILDEKVKQWLEIQLKKMFKKLFGNEWESVKIYRFAYHSIYTLAHWIYTLIGVWWEVVYFIPGVRERTHERLVKIGIAGEVEPIEERGIALQMADAGKEYQLGVKNMAGVSVDMVKANKIYELGTKKMAAIGVVTGLVIVGISLFMALPLTAWLLPVIIPLIVQWALKSAYVFSGAHKGRSFAEKTVLFGVGLVLAAALAAPAIFVLMGVPISSVPLLGNVTDFLFGDITNLQEAVRAGFELHFLFHSFYNFIALITGLPLASIGGGAVSARSDGISSKVPPIVNKYHFGKPQRLISLYYAPEEIIRMEREDLKGRAIPDPNLTDNFNAIVEDLSRASNNLKQVPMVLQTARGLLQIINASFNVPYQYKKEFEMLLSEIETVIQNKKSPYLQREILRKALQMIVLRQVDLRKGLGTALDKARKNLEFELQFINLLDTRLAALMVENPNFHFEIVLNAPTPISYDPAQGSFKIDLLAIPFMTLSLKNEKHNILSKSSFFRGLVRLEMSRYVSARTMDESMRNVAWPLSDEEESMLAQIFAILYESADVNEDALRKKSAKHRHETETYVRDSLLRYLEDQGAGDLSLLFRQLAHLGEHALLEEKINFVYSYLVKHQKSLKARLPNLARIQQIAKAKYNPKKMEEIENEMGRDKYWIKVRSELMESERGLEREKEAEYASSFTKPSADEKAVEKEKEGDVEKRIIKRWKTIYEAPIYPIEEWEREINSALQEVLSQSEADQIAFFIGKVLPKYFLVYTNRSSEDVMTRVTGLIQNVLDQLMQGKGDEALEFSRLVKRLILKKIEENEFKEISKAARNSSYLYGLGLFLGLDLIQFKQDDEKFEILYGMAHRIDRSKDFKVYNQGIDGRELPIHYLGERLDSLDKDFKAYGFTYMGDIFGVVVKGVIRGFVLNNVLPILRKRAYYDDDPHSLTESVAKVFRKEFQGMDQELIEENVQELTAIHEMQHTVDELLEVERGKKMSMAETETSAYLASIALSNVPFTSLVKVILIYTSPMASIFSPNHYKASKKILQEFSISLGLHWNEKAHRLDQADAVLKEALKLSSLKLKETARTVHANLFGENGLANLKPPVEKAALEVEEKGDVELPVIPRMDTGLNKKIFKAAVWLVTILSFGWFLWSSAPPFIQKIISSTPFPAPITSPSPAPTLTSTSPKESYHKLKRGELSALFLPIYHKVKRGESLSEISARYYGHPWYYQKIYEANRSRMKYPWPKLPENYKEELPFPSVGDELIVPEGDQPFYYKVRVGETLRDIAKRYYGDEDDSKASKMSTGGMVGTGAKEGKMLSGAMVGDIEKTDTRDYSEIIENLFLANHSRIKDKEHRRIKSGTILVLPAPGLKTQEGLTKNEAELKGGAIKFHEALIAALGSGIFGWFFAYIFYLDRLQGGSLVLSPEWQMILYLPAIFMGSVALLSLAVKPLGILISGSKSEPSKLGKSSKQDISLQSKSARKPANLSLFLQFAEEDESVSFFEVKNRTLKVNPFVKRFFSLFPVWIQNIILYGLGIVGHETSHLKGSNELEAYFLTQIAPFIIGVFFSSFIFGPFVWLSLIFGMIFVALVSSLSYIIHGVRIGNIEQLMEVHKFSEFYLKYRVRKIFKSQFVKKQGKDFLALERTSGKGASALFSFGFAALKSKFSMPWIDRRWNEIVELGLAAEESSWKFFYGLHNFGVEWVEENFLAVKTRWLSILSHTSKFNRGKIIDLLLGMDHFVKSKKSHVDFLKKNGAELLKHYAFYDSILANEKRLGYQILDGLFEGMREGVVDVHLPLEEQERIREFIKGLHSFSPSLYRLYKQEGDGIFRELQEFSDRCVQDEVNVEDIRKFIQRYKEKGADGMEVLIAAIQVNLPASGDSTVKREDIRAHFEKILEAGDLRGQIPVSLQGIDFGEGEEGAIGVIERVLKQGEILDPEKEIEGLFRSLNLEKEGDLEDREEQSQKARENLKKRLRVYFSNGMNSTNEGEVLNSFYEFARNDDQVKELVAQILPEDYQGLGMLQGLFIVEGIFSIMLREVIEELFQEETDLVPVSSLVKEKSDVHLQNTAREIERIWNQVRVDKSRKREIIGKIVLQTDPEGIERIVLNQIEDLELRELVSSLSHQPRKTEPMAVIKIIEGLFKKSLEMIAREKDKFEYRQVDKNIILEFRLVKGIPYGLWGLNAGVCTADDVTLWQKEEFMLLALIDRESGKVYGFVEIFKQKINGREVLTVPGIDPNIELLSQVKEEDVYPLIESALIKLARAGGYQALYYPQESHLLSNRPGIVKIVEKRFKDKKTELPLIVDWNESPQPYPFSEVYEVWIEEEQDIKLREKEAKGLEVSVEGSEAGVREISTPSSDLRDQERGQAIKASEAILAGLASAGISLVIGLAYIVLTGQEAPIQWVAILSIPAIFMGSLVLFIWVSKLVGGVLRPTTIEGDLDLFLLSAVRYSAVSFMEVQGRTTRINPAVLGFFSLFPGWMQNLILYSFGIIGHEVAHLRGHGEIHAYGWMQILPAFYGSFIFGAIANHFSASLLVVILSGGVGAVLAVGLWSYYYVMKFFDLGEVKRAAGLIEDEMILDIVFYMSSIRIRERSEQLEFEIENHLASLSNREEVERSLRSMKERLDKKLETLKVGELLYHLLMISNKERIPGVAQGLGQLIERLENVGVGNYEFYGIVSHLLKEDREDVEEVMDLYGEIAENLNRRNIGSYFIWRIIKGLSSVPVVQLKELAREETAEAYFKFIQKVAKRKEKSEVQSLYSQDSPILLADGKRESGYPDGYSYSGSVLSAISHLPGSAKRALELVEEDEKYERIKRFLERFLAGEGELAEVYLKLPK